MQPERDRAWRRKQARTKIRRKKKISADYWYIPEGEEHRLSKGKIHCSCPMCSHKTKYAGPSRRDKRNREGGIQDVFQAGEWEE